MFKYKIIIIPSKLEIGIGANGYNEQRYKKSQIQPPMINTFFHTQ